MFLRNLFSDFIVKRILYTRITFVYFNLIETGGERIKYTPYICIFKKHIYVSQNRIWTEQMKTTLIMGLHIQIWFWGSCGLIKIMISYISVR